MRLEEMQRRKKELGYSNEKLSRLSGLPLGTVQEVMSGRTKRPRQSTLESLARALADRQPAACFYPGEMTGGCARLLKEPAVTYSSDKKIFTIEDIYALPEGVRAELIDGEIFFMASPSRTHQKVTGEMYLAVASYIRSHGGECEVYIPPYGVYLNGDDSVYVEPDLTVICDPSRSEEKGCVGAPDWRVEVVSPSSKRMDFLIKLLKYRSAGVREYWIINPDKRIVLVYSRAGEEETVEMYSFEDEIPSGTWPDLRIRLGDVV